MTEMFATESHVNEMLATDDTDLSASSASSVKSVAKTQRVFDLGREWRNGKQEVVQVANRQADAGD